jgi:NagD protein
VLDGVQAVVLDVDGTLVHRAGDAVHVQPGAREVLARIRASGRRLAIFTNGSHESPAWFAEGLRAAGLDIADEEMLTPLRSVQAYLRLGRLEGPVLAFATDPARQFLEAESMSLASDDGPVDAVFVAHADTVDFALLERAARAIIAGARLLTASYAPAYAGADGPILSRGAMTTAALAKASSTRPVIVGKPSRAAMRTVEEQVGCARQRDCRDRRRPDDGRRAGPPRRCPDGTRRQRDQRPRRPARDPGAPPAGRRRRRSSRTARVALTRLLTKT